MPRMESRALHGLGEGSATQLHSQPLYHVLKEMCLPLWLPLHLRHELTETQGNPSMHRECVWGGRQDTEQASLTQSQSEFTPLCTDTGRFMVLVHSPASFEGAVFLFCFVLF